MGFVAGQFVGVGLGFFLGLGLVAKTNEPT
jgi:F0F1-type ATP synthase assembly protein I